MKMKSYVAHKFVSELRVKIYSFTLHSQVWTTTLPKHSPDKSLPVMQLVMSINLTNPADGVNLILNPNLIWRILNTTCKSEHVTNYKSVYSRIGVWTATAIRHCADQTPFGHVHVARADKSQDHSRAHTSLHVAHTPRNWRRRPSSKSTHWLRTVEEDLSQFNLGLASGLRRAQNRKKWRTLTGTATSPTSSEFDWLIDPHCSILGESVLSLWIYRRQRNLTRKVTYVLDRWRPKDPVQPMGGGLQLQCIWNSIERVTKW